MEAVLTWITPILITGLGFFLVRFVQRYDVFEKETYKKLSSIDIKITSFEERLSNVLGSINNNIHDAKMDANTRAELSQLKREINSYSDLLNGRLSEAITTMENNFGKVVWIKDFKDMSEAQEKKIKGLYDVIDSLVQKSKKA